MSTSSVMTVTDQRTGTWLGLAADYVELTKPRILLMVLITVGIAGLAATQGQVGMMQLFNAVLATGLVAASASAMNQWLERFSDARMPRTANRPLPAGRLSPTQVLVFGLLTVVVGLFYLEITCGGVATAFAALTWFLYVCVYTPMKTRTWLNTAVGAIPGALPVLIGWTATGASLDTRAWALFLVVFLWQFPHFMAIAWLYRKQYAEAEMPMLPVVDSTGWSAGIHAVVGAVLMLFASLWPLETWQASSIYLIGSLILGVVMVGFAISFFRHRNDLTARRLLRISLIYLPIQLALATMLNLGLI
ncbi:MAG: protoheme IX farnesyltransferase [Planctomycetaceae bacterium]|nr:protoheme IX farnesyltransferase [Planctomycetaceae bacterium]